MSTPDHLTPPPEPGIPDLPAHWSARMPEYGDVEALVRLRHLDELQGTGGAHVNVAGIENEIVGQDFRNRHQPARTD
ncbi:hypothetical protein [Aeromicrobium sp. CTD01-1L150]|uniref:hypothetical protein n=1 Tax=Aeromicrobium sp. CTD01-1L150 TaxID=3341830 RepID=UPI0035BF3333